MKIHINGNEELIDGTNLTVLDLLKIKKVEMPEAVSVELNGNILDRDSYGSTIVQEGQKIEFLYFMGGGAQ